MILIDKNTKVIIDIIDTASIVNGGILVTKGDLQYGYMVSNNFDIINIDVPNDIEIQKHKYIDGGFLINENYIEPELIEEIPDNVD